MNYNEFEEEIYELKKSAYNIMSEKEFYLMFNHVFGKYNCSQLDVIISTLKRYMHEFADHQRFGETVH